MRMQLCRTKFRKSCILLAKNWIKCFPGDNPVKSRRKSWKISCCPADSGRGVRLPDSGRLLQTANRPAKADPGVGIRPPRLELRFSSGLHPEIGSSTQCAAVCYMFSHRSCWDSEKHLGQLLTLGQGRRRPAAVNLGANRRPVAVGKPSRGWGWAGARWSSSGWVGTSTAGRARSGTGPSRAVDRLHHRADAGSSDFSGGARAESLDCRSGTVTRLGLVGDWPTWRMVQ